MTLSMVLCGLVAAVITWWACRNRSTATEAGLLARITDRDGEVARLQAEAQSVSALQQDVARLEAELDAERRHSREKESLLLKAESGLRDAFKALSAEALKDNGRLFMDMARSELAQLKVGADNDLETRHEAINGLIRPLADSLRMVDSKIQEVERGRVEAYSALKQQLSGMAETQQQLQTEAGNLVKALRSPVVRGRWGELQLGRVVELAGMVEHCDFTQQVSVNGDDKVVRPDMVVRLPGGKTVVVDAKAPLAAYLQALEEKDEDRRAAFMTDHARQVRAHMTNLGGKAYWSQFDSSPEFVVMFLPGETFFSAALQEDPALIEFGVTQRVIPASPTTLIALLRAVSFGWQQEALTENAQEISRTGRTLYERLIVMADHLEGLRKNLDRTVSAYNKVAASYEGRVLVTARKLRDMGVGATKELGAVRGIERRALGQGT